MCEKWDLEADIVIVGSGFAGLSAAIEANDAGATVVVLEKMPRAGGNSIIAGDGYAAVDPARQVLQGIEDSLSLHYKHTIEGGDYRGEPEKVWFMVENALDALHWLEKMGVKFLPTVSQGYGTLWPREHHTIGPHSSILRTLLSQADKRGIKIRLKHKVTRIVREKPSEGRILGVIVEIQGKKLQFKAKKAVILASGGFGADVKMRIKYDPGFDERFSTTNHTGATGECIKMACDVGADLKGMDYIQCVVQGRDIRTGKGRVGQMAPIWRMVGWDLIDRIIYTNLKGERIVASDARRDCLTEAAMKTDEKVIVTIGDDLCREVCDIISRSEAENLGKKYPNEVFKGDTIGELASRIGMNPRALENTVDKFNSYVDAKHDPDFGQSPSNLQYKIEKPPFWGGTSSPAVHFSMGGLVVKGTTTQVVDRWGNVIPNFYAAGEVTGGVHGTNRIGANAIPDCIVFGRVAGRNASKQEKSM